MMRLNFVAILGIAMLVLGGCGGASDVATDEGAASASDATSSVTSSPGPAPGSACPDTPTTGDSLVMVDFVDVVQLNGTQYLAGGPDGEVPPVAADQLRDVVGTVECELSILKFQEQPGSIVDGDAAFIEVGTDVHAIKGFDPSCRVAAEVDGENRVYLAQVDGGRVSRAVPCAKAP